MRSSKPLWQNSRDSDRWFACVTFPNPPSIGRRGDHMRTIARIAFAAALPWAAFAQSDFNWSGTLSPGQTLEIKGVNGSIHAELASGVLIEVSARKTAKRSDPNSVRVEASPNANGMTICTVYTGD